MVPLIIRMPGKQPAVSHSLVKLIDLNPAVARLCGLDVPARWQDRDVSRRFAAPTHRVRETAFCAAPSSKGVWLRDDQWADLQDAEDASQGVELFAMTSAPKQSTNLAGKPEFAAVVTAFQAKLSQQLRDVRDHNLRLETTSGK